MKKTGEFEYMVLKTCWRSFGISLGGHLVFTVGICSCVLFDNLCVNMSNMCVVLVLLVVFHGSSIVCLVC